MNNCKKIINTRVFFALVFILCVFPLNTIGQIATIDSTINKLSKIKSGQIEVTYKNKGVFTKDTSIVKQSVGFTYLNDSLFNLIVKEGNDSFLYRGKYCYMFNNDTAKIKQKLYTDIIPYTSFFLPNRVALKKTLYNDQNELILLDSPIIKGIKYDLYKVTFPNSDDFSNIFIKFYVIKNNNLVSKIITNVDYLGEHQYEEININYIKTCNKEDIKLQSKILKITKYFKKINVNKNIEKETTTTELDNDTLLNTPYPIGKIHKIGGGFFDFMQVNSKLLLIDFWYISCYPCLKAIPSIVKLDSIYADSILNIVGVNAFDKKEDKIINIMNKLSIKYPILYNEKSIVENFKVSSYPQIFIFDVNSKRCIYHSYGYNPHIFTNLNGFIASYILKH